MLITFRSDRNYACGFGMIETGYTGSTYEGLWVAGVLAALKQAGPLRYGADADHLPIGPQLRLRIRNDRNRVYRQHLRRAMGGRGAGGAKTSRPPALRRGC